MTFADTVTGIVKTVIILMLPVSPVYYVYYLFSFVTGIYIFVFLDPMGSILASFHCSYSPGLHAEIYLGKVN